MSLFNLWEEGKYFTELIGSEANDSVETFNSFLASQTVRLENRAAVYSSSNKSQALLFSGSIFIGPLKKEKRTKAR